MKENWWKTRYVVYRESIGDIEAKVGRTTGNIIWDKVGDRLIDKIRTRIRSKIYRVLRI